jgi:glycosyltransferase involved in cell wall biosynthesis
MKDASSELEKYNVVFLGARDGYQVAIALQEAGRLNRLVTDFYAKGFFARLTRKRRANELSGTSVMALLPFAVALKAFGSSRWNRLRRYAVDFAFGFCAACLTHLGPNRAIVYSYYLPGFCAYYRLVRRRPRRLICFQVHPSARLINNLLEVDQQRFAQVRKIAFQQDIEASYDEAAAKAYADDIAMCDGIIAASSFSIRSLFPTGAPDKPVCVIPYGSKLRAIDATESRRGGASKIVLLTVCQLTQRKGMHWAFEAMDRLPNELRERFEWRIVSNHGDPAIAALKPSNAVFLRNLSDRELAAELRSADLFVLPSIVEGFGLVFVEALSQGTPIVYTENTGPPDFCVDGIHGFHVRASDLDDLESLFGRLAKDDGSALAGMRDPCRHLYEVTTWPLFRQRLREFTSQIEGVPAR